MNPVALPFFLVCAVATLSVPRRWAPVPLLIGCCYMTMGQGIEIWMFSFPVFRMLLGIGLLRVVLKGERIQGRLNSIDKLMIAWGAWMFIASFFHPFAPGSGPVYALGGIYNIQLSYFLLRIWCRTQAELKFIIAAIALLLVPIAITMWVEKIAVQNPFAIFGGVLETPVIREGRVRASGPFAHPILAGTVGATCLPLMAAIWKSQRFLASFGIAACLAMVLASASSGPLSSLLLGMIALCMFHYQRLTRYLMPALVIMYTLLSFVMSRPPYYLISYIDLTGGSTGWHRAALIEGFVRHFNEWWAFGTDRTRHWMPNASGPSPEHTDITNHYIAIAVGAGLLSLLLFLAILWRAFTWVSIAVNARTGDMSQTSFIAWCLGSSLFSHATTAISVAYFDQSVFFLWTTISLISSLHCFKQERSVASRLLLLKPTTFTPVMQK